MKIGNENYKYGLFLAPMAGVTDIAFRHMCKKYGAEGLTTEMISSKALVFGDRKTEELCKITNEERPCALQIFGSEPDTMAKAAKIALKFSPCTIDINMGCPAPKVANSGDGSALMKKPLLAYEIMKEVVSAVGDVIPVTVKIRSGFDENNINAAEIAELAQKAGVSAITVHARTRKQMYAPPVDLNVIRDVKSAVTIPVIGNGDINFAKDAEIMFEKTNCDGIMIGRGALGNPYIFYEIAYFLENKKEAPKIENAQKCADIREHLELMLAEKGEFIAAKEARKHISWYIKGMPGAALARDEVNRAVKMETVLSIVERVFAQ